MPASRTVPHDMATSIPWWKPWTPGQRSSWLYQGAVLQPNPIMMRCEPAYQGDRYQCSSVA